MFKLCLSYIFKTWKAYIRLIAFFSWIFGSALYFMDVGTDIKFAYLFHTYLSNGTNQTEGGRFYTYVNGTNQIEGDKGLEYQGRMK